MRSTGKSICSLIIVFVLILFAANQCATTRAVRPAEKRGADILIFKKNGSSVKGELLAVKNTLLLVQKKAGNPENIDVSEIKEIQVKYSLDNVKRNSAGNYLGGIIGGFFFGSAVGGAIGLLVTEGKSNDNIEDNNSRLRTGAIGAAVGGILGVIMGISTAAKSRPKRTKITYKIEGASEEDLQNTLSYLSAIGRNR